MRWRMFLETQPWRLGKSLHIVLLDPQGQGRRFLATMEFIRPPAGETVKPALEQTFEQEADGLGDVDGFLQAALDAAWDAGMRPTGFADHTHELKAVRYHLEDMRVLTGVAKK